MRQDYTLLDISDDGYLSLMDDGGNEKADLMLPKDDSIRKAIEEGFGADKELVITILKSMGEEMVCSVKEGKSEN